MKLSTLSLHHTSPIPMTPLQLTAKKVAVVGGGAAGLVAARELRNEGHKVVVFERGGQLGGTWVYSPEVESDPLGLDPTRKIVHSSVYNSLRTNLPREVMGFRDFPFVASGKDGRDARRFPGHEEVLTYLEDFGNEFKLHELVRYDTEVSHVGLEIEGKWKVKSRKTVGNGSEFDEMYDAVVVCNGHYTEPRIADIPGIEVWPGRQIHSHNYRIPEPYQNQVIVLIGSSASAVDICRDLSRFAKEVHVASRSKPDGNFGKQPGFDNLWLHPMIERAHEDGRVTFQDGSVVRADVILHCTGYKYHFPFLDNIDSVNVDDNRVGPLYKHIFPPALAPGISFVGLPWKVVPFILCELQSRWIAGILSGRISLPSEEIMMEDIKAFYSRLDAAGVPKRYTHNIGDHQFEYDDWLAVETGSPLIEEWRRGMYRATSLRRRAKPETYRDEWDDEDWILPAYQDFKHYKYHFPFLHDIDAVNVDDNRVGPLYKHVFPPSLAPGISFVGVPCKVVPFILFELQSRWIAGILSGRISLPSEEIMMEDVKAFYSKLNAAGVPKRYTHNINNHQFEYDDWLAVETGSPLIEEWRKGMQRATTLARSAKPETYRDEWYDEDWILSAYQDFKQYLPNQ